MDFSKQLEKAKAQALRFISYRPRSNFEVYQNLRKKGYEEKLIIQVIKIMEEYGFLNDRNFARQWVAGRSRHKPMGARRLKQELAVKGVPREIIEEALSELTFEEEVSLAQAVAVKRIQSRAINYRQLMSFLQRRGFSGEVARRVCRDAREYLI